MGIFRRLGSSELLPRYIFAEGLFTRRRVLEVGAVAATLGHSARFLASRGARSVVACDSDLSALEEAQRRYAAPNLRFRPQVFEDFEPAGFELVLVADLAPFVRAPELLRELSRLVGRGGYLMGGLRNLAGLALSQVMEPERGEEPPPTYGQLLDALSLHFHSVEVATQTPVLGYQLAFEKGEGLQVDGSLATPGEAAYFVVLAGEEPVRRFDPTWVQLPPEPLAFASARLEEQSLRARTWEERCARLKEALEKTRAELAVKEVDLKERLEELEGARQQSARLAAQLEVVSARPDQLRDRDELASRVKRLELELAQALERKGEAERRAEKLERELEEATRTRTDAGIRALAAEEQARLEKARREELSAELEDTRLRLTRAHQETRSSHQVTVAARGELPRLQDQLEALASERRLLEEEKGRLASQVELLERELSRSREETERFRGALAELKERPAFGSD